jgi:hypothetical protein
MKRADSSGEDIMSKKSAFTLKVGAESNDDISISHISKVDQLHQAAERKLLKRIKPIA